MIEQFRQGDILFETVDNVAQGFYQINEDGIIAYGEISGHKHMLTGNGQLLVRPHQQRGMNEEDSRIGYIVAKDDIVIMHDEHAPMPLKKGIYCVTQQREFVFDPIMNPNNYFLKSKPYSKPPQVKRIQD